MISAAQEMHLAAAECKHKFIAIDDKVIATIERHQDPGERQVLLDTWEKETKDAEESSKLHSERKWAWLLSLRESKPYHGFIQATQNTEQGFWQPPHQQPRVIVQPVPQAATPSPDENQNPWTQITSRQPRGGGQNRGRNQPFSGGRGNQNQPFSGGRGERGNQATPFRPVHGNFGYPHAQNGWRKNPNQFTGFTGQGENRGNYKPRSHGSRGQGWHPEQGRGGF
jgi:hypothetical protein